MALDDFGSGQTNLALIQRLPITGLKLAPDLVAALGDDPDVPDVTVVDADSPVGGTMRGVERRRRSVTDPAAGTSTTACRTSEPAR